SPPTGSSPSGPHAGGAPTPPGASLAPRCCSSSPPSPRRSPPCSGSPLWSSCPSARCCPPRSRPRTSPSPSSSPHALDESADLLGGVHHGFELRDEVEQIASNHRPIQRLLDGVNLGPDLHLPGRWLPRRREGSFCEQRSQRREVVSREHRVAVEVDVLPRLLS